jgi:hypothetical protein
MVAPSPTRPAALSVGAQPMSASSNELGELIAAVRRLEAKDAERDQRGKVNRGHLDQLRALVEDPRHGLAALQERVESVGESQGDQLGVAAARQRDDELRTELEETLAEVGALRACVMSASNPRDQPRHGATAEVAPSR